MKSVSHIILGALLASGAAVAANEKDSVDFDTADADRNGYLSQSEWRDIDYVVVDFENVDANRDGQLDRSEVRQATDSQSMRSQQASQAGTAGSGDTAAGGSATAGSDTGDDAGPTSTAGRTDEAAGMSVSAQNGQEDERPRGEFDADQMSEEFGAESETASTSGQASTQSQAGSAQSASAQGGQQGNQQGRQAFRDTDADRDNRVSRQEAEDAGYDYIVMYFDPIDRNRDGFLDENEWNLGEADASMRTGTGGEGMYDYEDTAGDTEYADFNNFEDWDVNADGYIDRDEAADADADWIDFHFDDTDADDDGLVDIGEANDGFMEWGDDDEEVIDSQDEL